MEKKLVKKIILNGKIELVTGLHIGGGNANIEIGGIDNTVIRTAVKGNQPYIPGSSLKGKMRCLYEQVNGCELGEGDAVKLFGSHDAHNPFASRLIVRDAYLNPDSKKLLEDKKHDLDMPYTENKYENSIKRIEGTAENPRITERIPAGVYFDVEFVLNIWNDEDEKTLRDMLDRCIRLLENDYLGGSGSRGYGQVKFHKELNDDKIWGKEIKL